MSNFPPSQNSPMSSLYFHPYRDSPDIEEAKTNVRIKSVERVESPARSWRQVWRAAAWPLTSPRTSISSNKLKRTSRRSCLRRVFLGIFIMLGIIQFISITCGIVLSFFPDEYDRAVHNWIPSANSSTTTDTTHWPTDISRDIIPVGCHSHNDYWRRIPLYSALQAGCTGVEADVWLFNDELYVGHTRSSLKEHQTLRSTYIDPLVTILDRQNQATKFNTDTNTKTSPTGIFDTNPSQSLILLIDFKTSGPETYHVVSKHLAPLRDRGYLTHFNGDTIIQRPVTIVGTGNTPFNLVTANTTYRDIFFDAPLDKLVDPGSEQADNIPNNPPLATGTGTDLGQGHSGMPAVITASTFNSSNSFYASVSFKKTIGFPWPFHFTQGQMERIRAQVRAAHRLGLKVRYWALPSWPRSLRNHVWRVLAQEGVDMLNVDDLVGATKGDWDSKVFDWWP
ncbi:hypothetical protein N7535_009162 [Penicillium sp. DV-2018c]|nr:hypothetical protein N7461_002937 [Penicillium sp. DV-2018c]KAJ5560965.1 hypothetical protein N7535_009162 [Penicillium sp. DV-2018c]